MMTQNFPPTRNTTCTHATAGSIDRRKKQCRRSRHLFDEELSAPMKYHLNLIALMVMAVVNLGGCYAFSPRRIQLETHAPKTTALPRLPTGISATQLEPEQHISTIHPTNLDADLYPGQDQLYRRRFVSQIFSTVSGGVLVSALGSPNTAWAESEVRTSRIIRLSSGLQFSDQRVGSGPMVQIPKTLDVSATTNMKTNSIDNSEGLEPDDPSIVLMHLKALKRDGAVLLDTFEDGKPILFRLGSIPSELYYLNEGGALAKGRIPLGVQDAILAQGAASWEGGFGKADAMRTGGIRKVVVPSELAYGSKGVSRYEALKLGLKQPVARNELLRYEIELLRCNDEVIDLQGSDGAMVKEDGSKSNGVAARACCIEEFYPCKMNGG